MDDESRNNWAIQLPKAFDVQLPQSSSMVTHQHREHPLHNNKETCTLHFRKGALHMAKHLSRPIKQAVCCLLRQSWHVGMPTSHSPWKRGNVIFSAKFCIPSWKPLYRPCVEELDWITLVGPFQLRQFCDFVADPLHLHLSLLNSHIHSQSPETEVVLSLGCSTREFWPTLGISWCYWHINKP